MRILKTTLKDCKAESGYTLIQMALAMIVLGVLTASFVSVYSLYNEAQKLITTQENVSNASQKLQAYRQSFGTYPCPAPMNVARDSSTPVYGRASNYAKYLVTGTTPLLPGQCADGICVESNIRADISATTIVRSRVGALPFRDMQMDEEETFDGYGSRLWYAVTEDMCNLSTLSEKLGGINIVNDLGESQTFPPKSATFIVISPGKNKVGAYSRLGIQDWACANTADSENCRDMSNPIQTDINAKYLVKFTVDATTTPGNIYDDLTEYFSVSANMLWRRMTPTSENILDMGNSKIAIGPSLPVAEMDITQTGVNASGVIVPKNTPTPTTVPPTPTISNGALRSTGGKVMAQQYCNESGGDCFQVNDLMGKTSDGTGGMKCPLGTYPVGITTTGTGAAQRAAFVCVDDITIQCPSTKILKGFTISGQTLVPNCTDAAFYASCPAIAKTTCATNDVTLTSQAHGAISATYSTGECRKTSFKCNNGTWDVYSATGSCVATITQTNNIACGECLSGVYSQITNSCTGTTNTKALSCNCAACSKNRFLSCPTNLPTGTGPTIRDDYACNPLNPKEAAHQIEPFSGTQTNPGTCKCEVVGYNSFQACPDGQVRNPGAVAVVPQANPATNSWPTDVRMGIYVPYNLDTPTCKAIAGTAVNTCSCDTSDKYKGETPAITDSCKQAKAGSRSYNGVGYGWNQDVYKKTIVNAASCTFTDWEKISDAQFENKNVFWRELPGSLSGSGKSRDGNYPTVDRICSCADDGLGSTMPCQRANAVGSYDNYRCACNP